ncbi:MAG: hypothetical protein WAS72_08735, partial [Saprospiraceae bacterium]
MKRCFTLLAALLFLNTCFSQINCDISNVTATTSPCNSAGQYYVDLDFDYVNVNDSFRVQGGGIQYGIFAYNQLPITLGPFSGINGTAHEFVVRDIVFNDCQDFVNVNAVNCNPSDSCHVYDLVANDVHCVNGAVNA